MSAGDIFKKSFLEGYASGALTIGSIAACLGIAGLLGIYIFFAYRLLCRREFLNKNFSIALIALAEITAAIILTVQSNVVISLGMVGALSIVRFRTAIKDPLDLIFLFWAISVGIICGAGLAIVAVAVSAVLSVLLWIFNAVPAAKSPVLLLVSSTDLKSEAQILEAAKPFCKRCTVKSRSLTADRLDLVAEVRTADEAGLSTAVQAIPGVVSVSVVAHNGETTYQ
ncbi:MAG: DUF4956 domain-containing protein [Oscillospiraceae bacterium]|jgi:hypothetical protein|nr:DUF4956 domain-containing protein [Oscillospiraceae bacterium]MBQ2153483.1 DUF4956 domain-containing protein [Oscillospiraceae bacterium]